MQKKLLGIAVAAALAPAAAFAQPAGTGVQLYGVFDLQAMHNDFDGPADAEVKKGSMHSSASRFGIRGRESLGAGLNAWFQAEMGVALDGRPSVESTPNGVNWLGGRDSGLGLDGGWGTVMLGIWGTPYKVANLATWNLGTYGIVSHYGVVMNGDTTGTESSPFCSGAFGTAACDGTLVSGSSTGFGRRASNTLQYWTPNWGGFQARFATSYFNSLKVTDAAPIDHDPQLLSASLMWSGGPFTVGGAYERHNGFRATLASTDTDATDDAWFIGGKWTAGPFAIGGAYEMREYEDTGLADGFEISSWVINGTFNMGSGQFFAGYSQQENEDCGAGVAGICADGGEASMLTLGYAHNLSKRTKVYANFGQIKNDSGTAVYYIAGPSGNGGGFGTTSGIVGGTDVRTFGVGVQHSF